MLQSLNTKMEILQKNQSDNANMDSKSYEQLKKLGNNNEYLDRDNIELKKQIKILEDNND